MTRWKSERRQTPAWNRRRKSRRSWGCRQARAKPNRFPPTSRSCPTWRRAKGQISRAHPAPRRQGWQPRTTEAKGWSFCVGHVSSPIESWDIGPGDRSEEIVLTVIGARYRLGQGPLPPRYCSSGRRQLRSQRSAVPGKPRRSRPAVSDQPGLEANARRGAFTDRRVAGTGRKVKSKIVIVAIRKARWKITRL